MNYFFKVTSTSLTDNHARLTDPLFEDVVLAFALSPEDGYSKTCDILGAALSLYDSLMAEGDYFGHNYRGDIIRLFFAFDCDGLSYGGVEIDVAGGMACNFNFRDMPEVEMAINAARYLRQKANPGVEISALMYRVEDLEAALRHVEGLIRLTGSAIRRGHEDRADEHITDALANIKDVKNIDRPLEHAEDWMMECADRAEA